MSDFDYNDYMIPTELSKNADFDEKSNRDLLLHAVNFRDSETSAVEIHGHDLAIIGITENRNSDNKDACKAADSIRYELYRLFSPGNIKVIDLGNLKNGQTANDTYIALTEVIYSLLLNESAIILLGGSKDMIIPACKAYENGKKYFSLCAVEPRFCLGESEAPHANTWLSHLIKKNKRLFNYSNIGYQSYYNPLRNIHYVHDRFEAVRLGLARTFIFQNEPYIRDADFFAVDIRSIKSSDAPGTDHASINGFYGEEICQLSRYAGLSDRLSIFGIFEMNPENDTGNITAELSGQMIWYFIQSFYNRKQEYPDSTIKKFKKYIVNIDGISDAVRFYKSSKSGRWWAEVNYHVKGDERSKMIACSYEDYLKATRNEIPERWLKLFNKLN